MGFWDLRDVNLARLAKQGWRLAQSNDSLLYQCFKARYFPRTNFLEAKVSPNCSFVWRSLMAAQPILQSGYCWRVGNGSSIRALRDRWIPNFPTNKVLNPVQGNWSDLMVSDLIDPELKTWRYEEIMAIFHRDEANAICQIPLSRRCVLDAIFWQPNPRGTFTVKSAYHVARKVRTDATRPGTSRSCDTKRIWAAIWKLRIPNKIKVFAWRACNDILPTTVNLTKRRILHDEKCLLCITEPETTIHALWDCVVAQDIWAGSVRKLQKGRHGQPDILHLMENCLDRLTANEFELFWTQAWLIWNQRNYVLHGGQIKSPDSWNKRAEELIVKFKGSQAQLTIQSRQQPIEDVWRPPPSEVYKLNFDAAIFADLGRTGFGAIIRNDKGEVMAAMTVTGQNVSTSDEAEFLACRRAIEFAVDIGFSRLIIEGDNSNVIHAISSFGENSFLFGNVVDDIRHLIRGLQWVSLCSIRRCGNKVAHVLAQYARHSLSEDLFWLEDTPPPAMEALYNDLLLI